MAVVTKSKISISSETPTISIPITIAQIAEGLRNVSKSELETLELLLDKKAMRIIEKSRSETNQKKLRKL
ncbi:hypothetical protein D4R78_03705 [bacterium]|nr:MAG: hypothetical protein D4R78_03705 [bacterium]